MITLAYHDERYVALLNCYAYKEHIKALGSYPDVRWDAAEKCWLLDLWLLPHLYEALPDVIAPMPAEFWLALPLPRPVEVRKARRRRRSSWQERQEEKVKAAQAGPHDAVRTGV